MSPTVVARRRRRGRTVEAVARTGRATTGPWPLGGAHRPRTSPGLEPAQCSRITPRVSAGTDPASGPTPPRDRPRLGTDPASGSTSPERPVHRNGARCSSTAPAGTCVPLAGTDLAPGAPVTGRMQYTDNPVEAGRTTDPNAATRGLVVEEAVVDPLPGTNISEATRFGPAGMLSCHRPAARQLSKAHAAACADTTCGLVRTDRSGDVDHDGDNTILAIGLAYLDFQRQVTAPFLEGPEIHRTAPRSSSRHDYGGFPSVARQGDQVRAAAETNGP